MFHPWKHICRQEEIQKPDRMELVSRARHTQRRKRRTGFLNHAPDLRTKVELYKDVGIANNNETQQMKDDLVLDQVRHGGKAKRK